MSTILEEVSQPELFIGIAGPIGVDMQEITDSVSSALKAVQYDCELIRVTSLIDEYQSHVERPVEKNYYTDINFKMDHANALCDGYGSPDIVARIGIREIIRRRADISGSDAVLPQRKAYIIRQLKRPSEVRLLRRVYGKQFVLISAYGSIDDRYHLIESKLKRALVPPSELHAKITHLMKRDASEDFEYGQQLRETFHLADVFIDGIRRREMEMGVDRFVQALFGRTDISPSKHEYGMYAAKSASLRSSDLSRQVGAAIFSPDGEIITQGCNEVPKAFGGTYWDLEEPDNRDVRLGHDPNDIQKRELLRDLFERMEAANLLSETALGHGTIAALVENVTSKAGSGNSSKAGALAGSDVMDLTEYGRVVHAEMSAVCDAARLGRSIKGATLFVTTFPCHNCTKHILASGISNVIYMEPYPKSRAKDLHPDEIEIEKSVSDKVSFVPFLGISPYRYRDIFQKGRRKRADGTARRWHDPSDIERPMIEVILPSYPDLEKAVLGPLIGDLKIGDGS